jgi:hypothetical protein
METASYFLRYISPILLSLITVVLLAVFNYCFCRVFVPERVAEPMEVLAYSILYAGPLAYALSFVFFFYGIELLRESWMFARIVFSVDVLLMLVGLIVNVAFLFRMKT